MVHFVHTPCEIPPSIVVMQILQYNLQINKKRQVECIHGQVTVVLFAVVSNCLSNYPKRVEEQLAAVLLLLGLISVLYSWYFWLMGYSISTYSG